MKKKLSSDEESAMAAAAAKGRAAWARGDIAEAETQFLQAWSVIPEPRLEHDHSESIANAMVTFYLKTQQMQKAREWLATTREAYGGGPNPHVDFVSATVEFEAGCFDEAFRIFDELHRQYGARPFGGQNRKYLDFYRHRLARR